jgi:hypothetical protein
MVWIGFRWAELETEGGARWNDTIPLVVVAHSITLDFVVFPSPPRLPLCPSVTMVGSGTGNKVGRGGVTAHVDELGWITSVRPAAPRRSLDGWSTEARFP